MPTDPYADPFVAMADSMLRSRARLLAHLQSAPDDGRSPIAALIDALRTSAGDESQRVRAAAVLIGGLPPALRDARRRELTELATLLPTTGVTDALRSTSPHVRAGARIIDALANQHSPLERHAPRPVPSDLRLPVGEMAFDYPTQGAAPRASRRAEARAPRAAAARAPGAATAQAPPGAERTMEPSARTVPQPVRRSRDSILAALAHPDAHVRLQAIDEAQRQAMDTDDQLAEAVLDVAICDPWPDVRVAAINAFGGQPSMVRAAAARRALNSHDPDVHLAAVELLHGGTDEEVVVAFEYVQYPSDVASSRAIRLVATARPSEAMALLWAVLPHDSQARQDDILAQLRTLDPRAFELLVRTALVSPRSDRRVVGLTATFQMDEPMTEHLVGALSDPAADVRLAALRSLARRWDPRALDAVAQCRLDPRPDIRVGALHLLSTCRDTRALPYLLTAAGDPVDDVQRAARDAIRSMASPDVIDRIVRDLDDPDTAAAAEAVLADMGAIVVPRLIALLDGLEADARARVVSILRSEKVGSQVRSALRDPEAPQRRRAAEVLVLLRGPDAVPALLDLLGDPDPSVRTASARLLGDVGDRTVVDALALAQLRDPDPGVVRSIEDAHRRVEGRVLADDVADGPGDR